MKNGLAVFLGMILSTALFACGGGGGGGDVPVTIPGNTPANKEPVAHAGADQPVLVGDTVTLDGSASGDADGDTLTYQWAFTARPNGSTATLSDLTAVKPTFTADAAGTFVLTLIVNDGRVDSAVDTVTITAAGPPTSSTVTLSWTGAAAGIPVGGLDVTIDYDEAKVSYNTVVAGSLTSGWYIEPFDNGDTVKTGMIAAASFDGGIASGSILQFTFNVASGVPSAADFVVAAVSYVDENYNTIPLAPADLTVTVVNQ